MSLRNAHKLYNQPTHKRFSNCLGHIEAYDDYETENIPSIRKQESKRTQTVRRDEIDPVASTENPVQKSEMSEKGQIKFMKSLLGKVKTLLHRDNGKPKRGKSEEKKLMAYKMPEKINAVTSDGKTNTLYGVLGNSKEKDGEKSVNVISIPLNALKKIAPSAEDDLQREKDSEDFLHMGKGTQVVLKPVSVRLANMKENKGVTSLVPVLLQNQVPRMTPLRSANFFPDGPGGEPFGTPRLPPYIIRRHEDILKDNKADERLFEGRKGDDGLYRDIGHIPGEIRFHHEPLEDQIQTRRPNLRHRNPARYHRVRFDDHDYDDDNEVDDDDDEDRDDDDDDDEDDYDDDNHEEFEYRNSPRMLAEERQIAATRKRLYDMLPGNDPTYTSENRGLGLPMRPDMMQMREAFLGNPMVQPGAGVNQRTMMPLLGAALAGEHADNSNDRSVFMLGGGQESRQVYGDSDNTNVQDSTMSPSSMRINSGGFTLGGSHAQSMSPNEVNFMLQKPDFENQMSEKDTITRPSHKHGGVLLKVNGHPIGDSRELRDHVVNGVVLKGKEKVIKSKGPVDVKVSKATDGVHSKVVDITSRDKAKVFEAKSKIAKSH